jgi:integrase
MPELLVKALKRQRSRQLEDRLAAGAEWHDTGLVFTTRKGKPLDGINVTRSFKKVLTRAGVSQRRFHDLRHTAASLLVAKNVHPRAVIGLLGHAEIRTTMDTYSHLLAEVREDTAHADGRSADRRRSREVMIGCQPAARCQTELYNQRFF